MRTICLCRKCFLISKLTFYLFQGYIGKQHFCLGWNYVHNASGMKIDQISVCPEVQFCAQQTFAANSRCSAWNCSLSCL